MSLNAGTAVENPAGLIVRLYDLTGRQIATSKLSVINYQLPTSGVYLIRADGQPARKVVVVR